MSGVSSSYTCIVPTEATPEVVAALDAHNENPDDGGGIVANLLEPYLDETCVYTNSRNNHMEGRLQRMVTAFDHQELVYLGRFSVALDGLILDRVIQGLRELFAQIQAAPVRFGALLPWDAATEAEVLEAFADPPASPAAALSRLQHPTRDDDAGQALWYVAAFLYVHQRVLETASRQGKSAVYALWPY